MANQQEGNSATDGGEHLLEAAVGGILCLQGLVVRGGERLDGQALSLEEGRDEHVLARVETRLVEADRAVLEEVDGIRHRLHQIGAAEERADTVAVDREVTDVERRAVHVLHAIGAGHLGEEVRGDGGNELVGVVESEFGAGKDELGGEGGLGGGGGSGGRGHYFLELVGERVLSVGTCGSNGRPVVGDEPISCAVRAPVARWLRHFASAPNRAQPFRPQHQGVPMSISTIVGRAARFLGLLPFRSDAFWPPALMLWPTRRM